MRDLNPDGVPTATTHLPHHNWTDTHATNPRPFPACTPDLRGNKSIPRDGPILSPRNMDRERHARKLGASCFDIASLAHASYHTGHYGAPCITASFLQDCGYTNITLDDVVTCFNDIVFTHERIYQLWTNHYTNRQVPKSAASLRRHSNSFPSSIPRPPMKLSTSMTVYRNSRQHTSLDLCRSMLLCFATASRASAYPVLASSGIPLWQRR